MLPRGRQVPGSLFERAPHSEHGIFKHAQFTDEDTEAGRGQEPAQDHPSGKQQSPDSLWAVWLPGRCS